MVSRMRQRNACCSSARRSSLGGSTAPLRAPEHYLLRAQTTIGNQAVQRSLAMQPSHRSGLGCPLLGPAPLQDVGELEVGHTDCDWDRNVGKYDVFKPRSGSAVTKIATDDCTKTCTQAHEEVHKKQVGPVCKDYYDCYTKAEKQAAADCKGSKDKDCQEIRELELKLDCFEKVAAAWNAQKWECEAYKASLACAQKLQQTADSKCSGKIGSYIYNASQSIKKYCPQEKESSPKSEKQTDPGKSKPAKPSDPDAPPKEVR